MDKVIVACCIALMLSGMIFGICLNSGSDTLDATYKVFGVVSGLAASLTALVALKALSTWKEQFFHNILYEKMTELESIGRNAKKWTPMVGHISSFLKWLTQLMLRIFAYRSRPHQE
ncbi:hypothetical protein [Vibrio cholerae]|uniref:hypothetical protein n=1 Tax=Vibrio cholerae TaxID=666 RepID=UPI00301DCE2B